MNDVEITEVLHRVLQREAEGIAQMGQRLNPQDSVPVVRRLLACRGRVVWMGMGKMGAVARKAAATFSSTGTPALFVQAAEALHGDMGMITGQDLLFGLSYSGETDEILRVAETVRPWGVPVVAVTGNRDSGLAKLADQILDVSVPREATDRWAVPTCSTTAALALCDALAIAVMESRGFTPQDFAVLHPGGALGRQLRIKVDDLMHRGDQIPQVQVADRLRDAIAEMSRKGLGATLIRDPEGRLLGVLTDGDVRRTLESCDNPLNLPVEQFMTAPAKVCQADWLAARALALMEQHRITVLPVVDATRRIDGMIHFHDLIRARLA